MTTPCGSCQLCCKGGQIIRLEKDDLDIYETKITPIGKALKHKENGDCIYLGEKGCTIYGKRPLVCKAFDCVGFYLVRGKDKRFEGDKVMERGKSLFMCGVKPQDENMAKFNK